MSVNRIPSDALLYRLMHCLHTLAEFFFFQIIVLSHGSCRLTSEAHGQRDKLYLPTSASQPSTLLINVARGDKNEAEPKEQCLLSLITG